MFAPHHRKVKILFGLSDVLLTALAFEAAYQTRVWMQLERVFFLTVPTKTLLLGFCALVWVLLGFWFEVYNKLDSAHPRTILRDTFRQCTTGFVAVVVFQFMLRLDLSRPFLGLFAVYSWILLCLFRLYAGQLVGAIRREFGAPHYVILVGLGPKARRLGEMLEQSAKYGIRIRGFLNDTAESSPRYVRLEQEYPVYPLEDLPQLLRHQVIDEVIFAITPQRLGELEEVLLMCDEEGVNTRVLLDFFPHVNSDMHLERIGPAPTLSFSAAPVDELRLLLKRAIDIALAAAALLLLFPVMLAIAGLIKLTSPGPVIFRQERCGLNGRRFVFYKFRSMCDRADEMKFALRHLNQKTTAFKIPNDPRLTPLGRYLRRFSIDEWPQLWNVLKGDMSIVGPRPAVPEEVREYKRWQRRRLRMRPGLTCLWAVSGRDALDFETWMKLDMQYIDSWSLSLDWKIILRTIPRVLTGKGAY
ncbi:MAG: sugar transferase [Bryobacteraceae bacterium]|nr:sugar transferase [Bryobacterales bacterium]MEB2361045.1 sugar transferase [Bryobacterales bacterium]NUN01122.1 sugar transferase [Bryobacteraceae bacterium]